MVESIREIVRNSVKRGELLDESVAAEWVSRLTESDLELLGWICLEHNSLLLVPVARLLFDALIGLASKLIESGSKEFSEFELIEYLGDLFQVTWQDKAFQAQQRSIKDHLARHVRGWPHRGRDAVITGVLEHIFCNDGVRRYFESWTRDPELREAYEEAIRLSDGFRKLG